MNPPAVSKRDRILGGLWGSLVGDALGVPVEFKDRATVQADPVKDMRGFGSHKQPPGTWSDDSSLLLCSADSLLHDEFDTEDMGKRFVSWHREELWTPHGRVFDIGVQRLSAPALSVCFFLVLGSKAKHSGRRCASDAGTLKPVSTMPSGSKICSLK